VDVSEYIAQARERYLTYYRHILRETRRENVPCVAEVWITPNKPPTDDDSSPPAEPMCFDMVSGEGDERRLGAVMVDAEVPTGGRIGTLRAADLVDVRVYPFAWELCVVWFAHPAGSRPVMEAIAAWKRKWMDPDRGADPADEDGLSGGAHFLGQAVAEGGGFHMEVDLGSAPLAALTELLDNVSRAGATEIELGRSDGSDIDPAVAAELQRRDLSPQRLTELLAMLLQRLPEVREAQLTGPQEISITLASERARGADSSAGDHRVFTNNLFLRLQRVGPEARAMELWRYVRGQRDTFTDSATDGVADLAQLRPVIKDDQFFAEMKKVMKNAKPLVARRLVGDISVCCVWDQPHGMRFVTADEPPKYGLSEEQFHERALRNYLESRAPVQFAGHGPLRVARTGDSYDATLLLADEFWREEAIGPISVEEDDDDDGGDDDVPEVKGELLVCVPAREIVLITGSQTDGGIQTMREVARRIEAGGDHLISQTILVRRGDRWERWDERPAMRGSREAPVSPPPPTMPPTRPSSRPQPRAAKPWWKFW
jgi:hypothetical protein